MKFISDYPLDAITAVPYNPRSITDAAYAELKRSLLAFGCVKPLIVNTNGNIVAGHQRSRALRELGIESAPVYQSTIPVSAGEEIRFNLVHNKLESDKAAVRIDIAGTPTREFVEVGYDRIQIQDRGYMSYVSEYCKLIIKFGVCGSVVVDDFGEVVHNGEYAYACFLLNKPCLVYRIDNSARSEITRAMTREYGEYDYSRIKTHSYAQALAQRERKDGYTESALYRDKVFPSVRRNDKILDFGSGRGFYYRRLKEQGYDAYEYEPYRKKIGSYTTLELASVRNMIKTLTSSIQTSGLFDVIVVDSVLNSVKDDEFQDYVLTSVDALVKETGVVYISTRSYTRELERQEARSATCNRIMGMRSFCYLDARGYTLTYRNSVWYTQKFYDRAELDAFLRRYFADVTITENRDVLTAVCKRKRRLDADKMRRALETEFNMEYPNGYRLNIHADLVDAILDANKNAAVES